MKFLIINEQKTKQLLPQLKSEFNVKKIYRINSEVEAIGCAPSVDWKKFHYLHSTLFVKLHDLTSVRDISVYLFTGNPISSMWALKNSMSAFQFFEVNKAEMDYHMEMLEKLVVADDLFFFADESIRWALEKWSTAVQTGYDQFINKNKEVEMLIDATNKIKGISEVVERRCMSMYEQLIAQEWTEDKA